MSHTKKCNYPNCQREAKAKDLCHSHYAQKARGKELRPLRSTDLRKLSMKDRLAAHAKVNEKGCWVWQKAKMDGYGVTSIKGKVVRAHRVSYEEHIGPIPEGSVVHHTCSERSCINPEHLQLLSSLENVAEMLERRAYQQRIAELEEQLAKALS